MPLRITEQVSDDGENSSSGANQHSSATTLKIQGSLYLQDAELLEKICRDMIDKTGRHIVLDLADLSFLDSESASVLCRLKREQQVTLEGLHLFIAKVIELTEAEAVASQYFSKHI